MPLLLVLFFLSGATGLVYELIWTRELIFVFGGTTYAITTVLVAFMGGLGLGSYVAGRYAAGLRQPGRVYGLLELVIGAYALLVPVLLGLTEPIYRALYPSLVGVPAALNAVRFVLCAIGLLLPTVCMGATLPILIRYVSARGVGVGHSVGLLYGVNTLGAVLGVVLTGFVLIPAIGLIATTWAAAAANVLVGILAIFVLRLDPQEAAARTPAARAPGVDDEAEAHPLPKPLRDAVLVTFAVSGFAAMVYQIMWTRALVMSIGSSTYSFTCILAAFILGLALGSLALARRIDRFREPLAVLGWLQVAIAVAAAAIVPALGYLPLVVSGLVRSMRGQWSLLLATEFALVIAVVLVPTFLIGGIFPLVTRLIAGPRGDASRAAGEAYLLNTVGTILGSFLAGFVLIRAFGLQGAVWLAAALNAVTGLWLLGQAAKLPAARIAQPGWAAALLVLAGGVTSIGLWDRELVTSAPFLGTDALKVEREIVYYEDGPDLTVCVQQEAGNPEFISLSVNGKPDASTTLGDMPNMLMLGHLGPVLSPVGGGDTCMIGLGGGLSLGALACHPNVQTIDCVELSDEVIRAAERFFSDFNGHAMADPRVEMIRADGRNHLLLTDRMYDVIVSQPSNPWIAGVSNLFTHEYFELARSRLKPDGRFVMWVQAYGTGVAEFRMIVRTLAESFGSLTVWDTAGGDYLFVASVEPIEVDLSALVRRLGAPTVRADLHRLGINHPGQFLGAFIAGDAPLREWSAGAPLHTDDNALLEFSAPKRMFTNETYEIAEALAARQQSPFETIVSFDPDSPVHAAVRERVDRAAKARRLRDEAVAAAQQGDVLAQLRAYAEGYRVDPGNIGISYGFHELMFHLREKNPNLQYDPRARPFLEELLGYRGPMLAPVEGGTLDEIAQFNAGLGREAVNAERWYMAGEYYEAAFAIRRDSVDLAMSLAICYSRSDRLDEAIALLDGVLAANPALPTAQFLRGQFAVFADDFDEALKRFEWSLEREFVSAADLAGNESLAKIHDDPRFRELLQRYQK